MSLQDYTSLASAALSGGMLLVWMVYAWLFFQEFQRRRSAVIFIHEAGGGRPESRCLLVNLSQEPVHVLCSLAVCDGSSMRLQNTSDQDQLSIVQQAKQGPLRAGDSLLLGSFEKISRELDRIVTQRTCRKSQLVEIRVAVIHGFREWPVGARRSFRIDEDTRRVTPDMAITEQLHSRRQAREVRRWLDDCRDP